MKLKQLTVKNFGSYKELNLDFSHTGLGLIYGRTGSGKSTIPDAPCWVLYGRTAKDGNADEVRSWQAENEPTTGTLEVELSNGTITVTRIRGAKNDLYWTEEATPDKKERGKDLVETQEFLGNRLGVPFALYTVASYYHEFSANASFFIAKARNRRELFEQITDLTFASRASEAFAEEKKKVKKEQESTQGCLDRTAGQLEQLSRQYTSSKASFEEWKNSRGRFLGEIAAKVTNFEHEKADSIKEAESKFYSFEDKNNACLEQTADRLKATRAKLNTGSDCLGSIETLKLTLKTLSKDICDTCGGPKKNKERDIILEQISRLTDEYNENREIYSDLVRLDREMHDLQNKPNPYMSLIKQSRELNNHHEARFEEERYKENPFENQLLSIKKELDSTTFEMQKLEALLKSLTHKLVSLSQLYDMSFELRGLLLRKSVKEIERSTNTYLEKYFDSEIKVSFELEEADNLTVRIQKSGYDCVYKQLSKGQRGLLKLCFVLSVMKAASNSSGVNFHNIFLDEALDGLDTELKIKAYSILEELSTEHDTVLIIEHTSEFQTMFSTKMHVTIDNDISEVALDE